MTKHSQKRPNLHSSEISCMKDKQECVILLTGLETRTVPLLQSGHASRGHFHTAGNYYLKYSWNTLCTKICITYFFIEDNPSILGNFLLFVGQDQLGENYPYLVYSHNCGSLTTFGKHWGSKNTFGYS